MAEKTGWVILEKDEQTTTYGMQTPTGTLVRTWTQHKDKEGTYHTSEAMEFIPGVMLKRKDATSFEFVFP